MTAPIISFTVTFSLKRIIDAGIISIGIIDMMVDATPVDACCTAKRDKETPKNGPKKDPMATTPITLRCFSDTARPFHCFMMVKKSENPINAAIALIWVPCMGLKLSSPYLLKTRPIP